MSLFALETGTTILIGLAVVAVVVVLWFIGIYNGLVALRNRYKNAYAQIDAMNGHASPNGESSADELRDLRREVQQLRRDQLETVARMHEAERKAQALEAELNTAQEAHAAVLASGNGKVDGEGEPPVGEGEQAARSLRARLTESAAQKKGKGGKFGFGS